MIQTAARLATGSAARTVLISVVTSLVESVAFALVRRVLPAPHLDRGAPPVLRASSSPRRLSKPRRISRSIRVPTSGLSKTSRATRI